MTIVDKKDVNEDICTVFDKEELTNEYLLYISSLAFKC